MEEEHTGEDDELRLGEERCIDDGDGLHTAAGAQGRHIHSTAREAKRKKATQEAGNQGSSVSSAGKQQLRALNIEDQEDEFRCAKLACLPAHRVYWKAKCASEEH